MNVFIVGGTGFLGSRVVSSLISAGHKVLVATRRPERAKHLISLPGVEITSVGLSSESDVAQTLNHGHSQGKIDAVISLAGILHGRYGNNDDPYGPDFGSVHVELPQRLALGCEQAGVKRLIHVSALGVVDGGKKTLPSCYLRSKAAGEQVVKQVFGLHTTVLRPSVIFGENDKFLNLFAQMHALAPFIPLAASQAKLQPVYVGDVAQAIVNSLNNPATYGKTFELAGPQVYTLRALVELAGNSALGFSKPVIALPNLVGRLQASVMEVLPGPTLLSRDNLDSTKVANIVQPKGDIGADEQLAATAKTLGLAWHALEPTIAGYMPARFQGHRFNAMRARAGR